MWWHQQKSTYTIGLLKRLLRQGGPARGACWSLGTNGVESIAKEYSHLSTRLRASWTNRAYYNRWSSQVTTRRPQGAPRRGQTAGLWMKHLKPWWREASALTSRVICFPARLGQLHPNIDTGSVSAIPSSPWARLCLEAYSEPFQLSSQTHHITWNSRKTDLTKLRFNFTPTVFIV